MKYIKLFENNYFDDEDEIAKYYREEYDDCKDYDWNHEKIICVIYRSFYEVEQDSPHIFMVNYAGKNIKFNIYNNYLLSKAFSNARFDMSRFMHDELGERPTIEINFEEPCTEKQIIDKIIEVIRLIKKYCPNYAIMIDKEDIKREELELNGLKFVKSINDRYIYML